MTSKSTVPYEINLTKIAALAAARKDEFEVLRYTVEFIEDELPDAALDELVDEIAAPIIAAIDCLECANCCNTIDVYLTPADVNWLAKGTNIPTKTLLKHFVDHDTAAAFGEWGKFKASPCTFLEGKRCTYYEYRPEACRIYPQFTPDFRWTLADTLEGAGRCPIIYHVLDRLSTRLLGDSTAPDTPAAAG